MIMAFANSSLFVSPAGNYTPFESVSTMRSRFDNGTKILIALGGWADTDGFSAGAATEASRTDFAKNIANMINNLGFDGVDIDVCINPDLFFSQIWDFDPMTRFGNVKRRSQTSVIFSADLHEVGVPRWKRSRLQTESQLRQSLPDRDIPSPTCCYQKRDWPQQALVHRSSGTRARYDCLHS